MKLFEDGTAPVSLEPLSRGDLDLRISASEGQVGPLTVGDLAASILVRDAAVEVALNRARLRDGVLKGRLILTSGADPTETEMKAQGGFDRIDLGGLMSDLGSARWVSGPLQGQFNLESHGRHAAGLVAGIAGRASIAIEGGALSGLDLTDVIHRNGGLAPGRSPAATAAPASSGRPSSCASPTGSGRLPRPTCVGQASPRPCADRFPCRTSASTSSRSWPPGRRPRPSAPCAS